MLPIYYKVKPSQLKYLTGRFRGAIDGHKRKMGEMVVNYWIEALREVTSVKGWKSEEFGHEGELVRSVVNEVMIELNGTKRIMSSIDKNEVPTKKPKAKVCEVFLSFRGKDTGEGFTSYLYTILEDAGIHVFKEDNDLRDGEQIGLELLGSIMQSKIAIPIISENYASSQWCLRELTLMLNCMRSGDQKVFPIFYKVEVWQVRNLGGRYGDAFN